jgi:anti-sigma factor ChrR (cupin superfamily)
MNYQAEPRCFCELAPLYALDLLDLEERLWVEAQVLACPDLAEELLNYQTAVDLLPYSAEPVPMAADLKDRLFDRLNLDPIEPVTTPQPPIPLDLPPVDQLFSIHAQDLNWKPHRTPGVQCAVLFVDPVQRMRSMVVKAAAGVVYPLHRHAGAEEIYMLEGELVVNGQTYFAGDYIRSHPGSSHAPATSTGCMFLIRACIDDEYF